MTLDQVDKLLSVYSDGHDTAATLLAEEENRVAMREALASAIAADPQPCDRVFH